MEKHVVIVLGCACLLHLNGASSWAICIYFSVFALKSIYLCTLPSPNLGWVGGDVKSQPLGTLLSLINGDKFVHESKPPSGKMQAICFYFLIRN